MISPLPLPDWVPWWVHLVLLIALLLFGLVFVLMPFSVFGVKGRLEAIDARLDEIQGEIRSLSLRLPEPSMIDPDEETAPARSGLRPPIPPAPAGVDRSLSSAGRPRRTEPRLY